MRRASASSSAPLALPWLTSTSAWLGATPASPSRKPFQPQDSIIHAAETLRLPSLLGREHRQVGEVLQQHVDLFQRQHRVLEEAAGVAQYIRVGQLAAADRDHGIGNVHCARQLHALCLQFLADAGVVHAQIVQQWQLQFDGGDQVAIRLRLNTLSR